MILAVGLAVALNLLMFAVLWDALRSDTPGLSENATQVVLAGFAGMTGLLGGYLGGRAVAQRDRAALQISRTDGPEEPRGGDDVET